MAWPLTLALLGFVVIVAWRIWHLNGPPPEAAPGRPERPQRPTPAPAGTRTIAEMAEPYHWPSIGDFDFEVVGESFHQRAIARLADATTPLVAHLVPYDTNPHDALAVGVRINGAFVGHLSREDARSFRRRLAAKKLAGQVTTCDAIITGGGGVDHDRHAWMYGVQLDLKPFE